MEQKYPLTRDPVNGDQFPIIDDGYLWSSIPRPEVKEVSGQVSWKEAEKGSFFIFFRFSWWKFIDGLRVIQRVMLVSLY